MSSQFAFCNISFAIILVKQLVGIFFSRFLAKRTKDILSQYTVAFAVCYRVTCSLQSTQYNARAFTYRIHQLSRRAIRCSWSDTRVVYFQFDLVCFRAREYAGLLNRKLGDRNSAIGLCRALYNTNIEKYGELRVSEAHAINIPKRFLGIHPFG